jgi:hypothetical protein
VCGRFSRQGGFYVSFPFCLIGFFFPVIVPSVDVAFFDVGCFTVLRGLRSRVFRYGCHTGST